MNTKSLLLIEKRHYRNFNVTVTARKLEMVIPNVTIRNTVLSTKFSHCKARGSHAVFVHICIAFFDLLEKAEKEEQNGKMQYDNAKYGNSRVAIYDKICL